MKKPGMIHLFLPVMLLMALAVLAACGKTPPVETRLIRVGFSQLGSESDWRLANTRSMTAALSEENGFELLFDNAKQRQENQLLAIRNFIQEEVDYIKRQRGPVFRSLLLTVRFPWRTRIFIPAGSGRTSARRVSWLYVGLRHFFSSTVGPGNPFGSSTFRERKVQPHRSVAQPRWNMPFGGIRNGKS